MVKLDADTLPTVPDAPPAAGPDRALDPPPNPRAPAEPLPAGAGPVLAGPVLADDGPVLAAAGPLLAVALTIPYDVPATAIAATPTAMDLLTLRDCMCGALFVDALDLGVAADACDAMDTNRKVAGRLAGPR